MLVEKNGTPRCAFVEPSTGSITASRPGTGRRPSTPTPRTARPGRRRAAPASAAASAARSRRYWPGRVPAGPQSSSPSSASAHGGGGLVEHCQQAIVVHG